MPQLLTQNETTVESLARPAWKMQWYFVFFIISGFCGLVYEVVWLRLAMASFGVTTALASIVISMFMAGLGLGSWGAGVLMRRTANSRLALRFYALAELLVGVSSIAVPYELRFGRSWLQHAAGFATWQGSFSTCWRAVQSCAFCLRPAWSAWGSKLSGFASSLPISEMLSMR
jgi:hypothetical protein